jgi:hypothetical protein
MLWSDGLKVCEVERVSPGERTCEISISGMLVLDCKIRRMAKNSCDSAHALCGRSRRYAPAPSVPAYN